MFGQTATSSGDGPPAKTAFVFGKSQDSQPSAPSAAPPNSTASPAPAQPFMFGASANAAAAPPAAAPAFGFGAVAPSVTSSSGLQSEAFEESFRCRLFGIYTFCFLFQLHLQLHPHLHLVQRHLVDSGPVRLLLSAHLDLLSQHRLPNPPPLLEPILIPIPLLSLDSRPTPPLHLGQMLTHQQVGICHSCICFHLHPCLGIDVLCSTGGGFQFGASGFGATNNTSGVFTFGAGAAASPAPPANPAIPPQTGAAGPGFNFAQAPSFNIG